jgi:hypothetical protein
MYTFVNKNYLVPIILNELNEDYALNKLYQETICRSKEYNESVYVICENENLTEIFYSDGISLYYKNNFKNNDAEIIGKYNRINFLNKNYMVNNFKLANSEDINLQSTSMNLTINNKFDTNVILIDTENLPISHQVQYTNEKKKVSFEHLNRIPNEISNEIPNEISNETLDKNIDDKYNKKREEIIKLIEQVNEMYQKEISNIKRLELNLKTFENKLNKLNKKKREEIINNIVKTQSEYQTWKKIKFTIKEENDVSKPIDQLELSNKTPPILFLSKYEYINKIQENEGIRNLLEEINLIDLNKLYSDDILPDNKIIQFCDKYVKLSKELHYHFDHEWDYLENELNLNSTNKFTN